MFQHLVLELSNLCLEYSLTGLVEDLHLAGVLRLLHEVANHKLSLPLLLG
jgi:hypothetical protein